MSEEPNETTEDRLTRLRQESCDHVWFNFHDGDDRVCTECGLHGYAPESKTMQLITLRARISALEGLLRECQSHVEARAVQEIENGYTNDHARLRALLSRLDAALTPDRKDQDGR